MKQKLIDKVSVVLLKKGFTVKNLASTCFDVLARKGSSILLIKMLEDANSVNSRYIDEMKNIAAHLSASPIIVAEKAGEELIDNVVYQRFGVNVLNMTTFFNSLDNKYPFLFKSNAGVTALINGKKLSQFREEQQISLAEISRRIGVSRSMIQRYESDSSEVTVENAEKLYELFGHGVFDKINIFNYKKSLLRPNMTDLSRKYFELGFDALDTVKVPFDIIAKKEGEIILTEVGDKANQNLPSLSKLLDADQLMIFRRKKPKDIPALKKEEFLGIGKSEELIKFLREF